MALDPAEFIADLSPADPPGTDPASQADDHMRATKNTIKQTWPGFLNAALDLTPAEFEGLDARLTALEGVIISEPSAPAAGQLLVPSSTTPIVVTGLGFQPAVIMFFAVVDIVAATSAGFSIGLVDGTTQITMHTASSLSNSSDFNGIVLDRCYNVERLSAARVTIASANFTSLDADGFTLQPVVVTNPCFLMWMAWE